MNVLGLNAYHADAAAALVRDGELVAAAEEERFRRVKHWAGLPAEAAAWCLEEAGISLADVDLLAVNRNPRANLGRKALYALRRRPSPGLLRDRLRNLGNVESVAAKLEAAVRHRGGPSSGSFRGTFRRVEHHRAHHASAFLVSPFDEAALLSVDGFGDFTSCSWGIGQGSEIQIDGRIHFPHSLGVFYLTLTQYLGFTRYGDEYKVMGLAPFGKPEFLKEMRRVVQLREDGTFRLDVEFFRHPTQDLRYQWDDGEPTVRSHYTPALEELLGPARPRGEPLQQRHKDIARSVQARFEEVVLALLEMLHRRHPTDAVVLSGGAAMNSAMNGRVIPDTPFRRVFVPPAPGDSGGAIGAALAAFSDLSTAPRRSVMLHSSYGQGFGEEALVRALEARAAELNARGCCSGVAESDAALCRGVAAEIADGRVLGWFQGRMEFGPRALGHRSILCDPRRPDMRDHINAKIKLREPFRPFAPSVLRERMGEWFEVDDDVPFMMKVYAVRADKRHRIPAVTHVDGTGRAQTVSRGGDPLYHQLISAFEQRTGVPMVLNTSFNENEPIVHRPEEAIDCFLRTDMDVLVLGRHVIRKRPSLPGSSGPRS